MPKSFKLISRKRKMKIRPLLVVTLSFFQLSFSKYLSYVFIELRYLWMLSSLFLYEFEYTKILLIADNQPSKYRTLSRSPNCDYGCFGLRHPLVKMINLLQIYTNVFQCDYVIWTILIIYFRATFLQTFYIIL